jgi:ribosomal protein S18 acetylase RimI-like enzyme
LSERDDYLVVETPGNPDFYWGNFLVFPHPPEPQDRERWPALFQKEFAHNPQIQHMAFTWDSPEGEKGYPFPGFDFQESPIYTLETAQPPARINEEVEVRPLQSSQDWQGALENQVNNRPEGFEPEGYFQFKQAQMARYRRMAEAGLGDWYGAFLQDRLVADAGLFHFHGLGRFQSVGTHADFRRQGIASSLIFNMARRGLKRSKTLVIVADPEHGADRVYRSVGFHGEEISVQLSRRAPRDQPPYFPDP